MAPLLPLAMTALLAAGYADIDYGLGAERDVVVDGLTLRVHEGGREDAPTVVLLHPFGLTMKIWRDTIATLEQDFHVVAYDAPGHGKSARPRKPLTLALLARTCVGLLDALGIEDAMLVGNSMGGGTALTVALDHPGRASAIVLIDSVGLDFSPWYGPAWRMLSPSDVHSSPDWAWTFAMDVATSVESPLIEELTADLLAVRSDPLDRDTSLPFWSIVAHMVVHDRSADLPSVTVPALVLTGTEDYVVSPDHARRLATGIRGAALVELDGLGHLPEAEDSGRVLEATLPFLRAHAGVRH
jgi:3-oxoadipate enol-lactonase/4-carboxymuconolactone decarboxylase